MASNSPRRGVGIARERVEGRTTARRAIPRPRGRLRVGRRVARAGVRRAGDLGADPIAPRRFCLPKAEKFSRFSAGTTTIYDVVDDGRAGSRRPPRPRGRFGAGRPARPVTPRARWSRVATTEAARESRSSARRVGGGATRRGRARRGARARRRIQQPRAGLASSPAFVPRLPSLGPPRDVLRGGADPRASDPNASEARGAPTLESDAPPVEDDTSDLTRPQRLRRPFPVALAPRDARARRPATERRVVVGTLPTHTRPRRWTPPPRARPPPSPSSSLTAVDAATSPPPPFSASFVLGGGGGGGGGSSDAASAARAARDRRLLGVRTRDAAWARTPPPPHPPARPRRRALHERYVAAYAWGARGDERRSGWAAIPIPPPSRRRRAASPRATGGTRRTSSAARRSAASSPATARCSPATIPRARVSREVARSRGRRDR